MRKSDHQQGFAAIAAIFLVVILAALGAFMLNFSNTQQMTSTQDLQGTRAYWAARAGLEWGIGRVSAVSDPSTIISTTCTTATPISIDNFSVTVFCSGFATPYVEGVSNRYILQFTSVAATGTVGSIGYIERSISASMER